MHQLIRTTTKKTRINLTRAQQRQVEETILQLWDTYFVKEQPTYEQAAAKLSKLFTFTVTRSCVEESVKALGKQWPRQGHNQTGTLAAEIIISKRNDNILANAIAELYQSLGQLAPPEVLALSNFPMPSDEQD